MVDKLKNKLFVVEFSFLIYFVLFFLNFIYTTNVVVRNELVYLSDVLLLIQLIVVLAFYITLKVFRTTDRFNLILHIYRRFLLILLFLHIVYFISIFIQSYLLIDETLIIIRDKILRGNPALILNFSNINYTTLSYVNGLLGSINSPIFVLLISLWTLKMYFNSEKFILEEESKKSYDTFLYDIKLPIFWGCLTISSFLSINLLVLNYTFYGSLEMFISISLFTISLHGYLTCNHFWNKRYRKTLSSDMTSSHYFLSFILKFILVLCILLISYNGIFNFPSYRIYPSSISLILSVILLIYHKRLKSLDWFFKNLFNIINM